MRAIGASSFPASEIVEARWVAERPGLEPPDRAAVVLDRQPEHRTRGALTGRFRKARQIDTHRSGGMPQRFGDDRKLDVVEQLIAVADTAGLPMTHLAMAFGIALHDVACTPPAVSSVGLRHRPVAGRSAA
ncbi:MAG: hypothetical protein QOG11_36 [Solirubrobacteraceae bacterium]|nr:hypothetical protein [Solirubrobacteraceae bacterium]